MNIWIRLPKWDWIHRLLDRRHPGLVQRSELTGTASETRSYAGGIIEIQTMVIQPPDDKP